MPALLVFDATGLTGSHGAEEGEEPKALPPRLSSHTWSNLIGGTAPSWLGTGSGGQQADNVLLEELVVLRGLGPRAPRQGL